MRLALRLALIVNPIQSFIRLIEINANVKQGRRISLSLALFLTCVLNDESKKKPGEKQIRIQQ